MNIALKNIRDKLNISQYRISKLIGIGRTRYAKYEYCERIMPPRIAYKIIDIAKSHGIFVTLEDIYPRPNANDNDIN